MRLVALAAFVILGISVPAHAELMLENMTSPEVREAIAAGNTTVIVATGGTEQTGPHIVLGKHNFTLKTTANIIARDLGNALVAPVMAYVPQGSITPPEGNMKFAGTLSLRPETFANVLEDTAGSLKQHGFKTICFIGENGASQSVQKAVADKLSAQWKDEGIKVVHVNAYYDDTNGQGTYLKTVGIKDENPLAHGGLADTAEQMAVNPSGVRENLRSTFTAAEFEKLGVYGASDKATVELGAKLIELKINAAVKQIKKETAKP